MYLYARRGFTTPCPTTRSLPYDCDAGFTSWQETWAVAKEPPQAKSLQRCNGSDDDKLLELWAMTQETHNEQQNCQRASMCGAQTFVDPPMSRNLPRLIDSGVSGFLCYHLSLEKLRRKL